MDLCVTLLAFYPIKPITNSNIWPIDNILVENIFLGDTEVTSGEAFINGFSILTQMNQVGIEYFKMWKQN